MILLDLVAAAALAATGLVLAGGALGLRRCLAASTRLVPASLAAVSAAGVASGQLTVMLVAWPILVLAAVRASSRTLARPGRGPLLGGSFFLLGLGALFAERLGPERVVSGASQSVVLAQLLALALLVAPVRPSRALLVVRPAAWIGVGLGVYLAGLAVGTAVGTARTSLLLPVVGELVVAEPARSLVVLGVALSLADELAAWRLIDRAPNARAVVPVAAAVSGATLIAWASGDLGGAMISGLSVVVVVAGMTDRRWPLALGAVGLVAAVALGWLVSANAHQRIEAWLDPGSLEAGDQQLLGVMALAEGGSLGTGFGASRSVFEVPEVSSDYVVTGLGHELGVAGIVAVVGGLIAVVAGGLSVARRAPTARLLAAGFAAAALIAVQAVVNLLGITLAAPLTGVPISFLSRGGVYLVTCALLVRVLLAVPSGPSRSRPDAPGAPPVVRGEWGVTAPRRRDVPLGSPRTGVASLAWALVVLVALSGARVVYLTAGGEGWRGQGRNARAAIGWSVGERPLVDRHGQAIADTVDGSEGRARRSLLPASELLVTLADLNLRTETAEATERTLLGEQERPPLRLAIDGGLQEAAAAAIQGQPEGAVVAAVDASSGELLALAANISAPREGLRAWPPGSVFKPVVFAAALDAGVIDVNSTFPVEARYAGVRNAGARPCGGSLAVVLGYSCNAAAVRALLATPLPALRSTFSAFGLDGGVELLGVESSGVGELRPGTAIGQQDVRLNPLSAAGIAAAVAEDGWLPSIRLTPGDGDRQRVMSSSTARFLAGGMRLAVSEGTAAAAGLPAGAAAKTGTAQSGEGYDHAWAIGFASVGGRSLAAAVFIPGAPERSATGGGDAAPILGRVLASWEEA